jgi:uncharacterized protein (DUF427 family)
MGLSWQQGPLSPGAIGRFLVPEALPKRLLYSEPLRRRMRIRFGGICIADSEDVLLLFEPGHYPMAYFREADVSPGTLQRTDVDESALTPVERPTFGPYKGLCSYYDIGDAHLAAWSYRDAYSQVGRISDLVSFEPDIVSVQLDGTQLRLEPGQTVIPHGPDRDLDVPAATGTQP